MKPHLFRRFIPWPEGPGFYRRLAARGRMRFSGQSGHGRCAHFRDEGAPAWDPSRICRWLMRKGNPPDMRKGALERDSHECSHGARQSRAGFRSSFDELQGFLDGDGRRRREEKVNVVRHQDEGVELIARLRDRRSGHSAIAARSRPFERCGDDSP